MAYSTALYTTLALSSSLALASYIFSSPRLSAKECEGKVVLITGCSRGGIGSGLAQEFKKKGLRVFATARNAAKMAHLKELGIETLVLDVTDVESVKEAAAKVSEATGGRLDFLINNAGVSNATPFADISLSAAKEVFDVNFFAILTVTQSFLPLLIKSGGLVANIASIAPIVGPPFLSFYAASKGALRALGTVMRLEFSPLGVKVVTIITGALNTNLNDNLPGVNLPKGSLYEPIRKKVEGLAFVEKGMEGVKDGSLGVYCKTVVDDLLKVRPAKVLWRGEMIWSAWCLDTFLPEGLVDSIVLKVANLDKPLVAKA